MNQKSDKYLEVDGVVYDISSGRIVSDKQKKPSRNAQNTVLDLRTPHNIVASSQRAISKREVRYGAGYRAQSTKSIDSSFDRKKNKQHTNIVRAHQTKTKPVARTKSINSIPEPPGGAKIKEHDNTDYLSFVLFKGIFAKANLRLWQLSLVRTVFSPQTWLLLTLPLILLQVRVIRHYTLNETIQKAKSLVAPDNYSEVSIAIGITLAVFLLGVIIRSCITATGISIRLREIDNRPIKIVNALRSSMHSIIRQALNYFIHLVIILVITLGLLLISKNLFMSNDPWIANSKYQIVVALFIVWLVILVFLYTKHWLQVGLLSRSSKSTHIQINSIKLLLTTPSANVVSGLVGLVLIAVSYGIIFSMSWFVTNYFVTQADAPAVVILIIIAFTTIILLTSLQYVQQSIWARQYYYSSLNSRDSGELLYMEPSKPDSIWPIFVVISISSVLMIVYFFAVSLYSSRLKGFLANLHASIPDEVNIVVPIKK